MAIIHNGCTGRTYLGVEVSIDKRLPPSGLFSRGPVFSSNAPKDDEMGEDLWDAVTAKITEELEEEESIFPITNWPEIDQSKVGWLCCTFRMMVGENTIFEHGILVQYGTLWNWFYTVRDLLASEHEDEEVVYSGFESPELRMTLQRSPIDPLYFDTPPDKTVYGHSLQIFVNPCIAEGGGVTLDGPGMYLGIEEAELMAFSQQLLDEAHQAG